MKEFFQKKLVQPILDLLKQGLTPEKLSASLAAGIVICCFPVIGLTTVLCLIFATIFRLNHVAIQLANYFSYPLQIALIIPFLHAGNWIFGVQRMQFNLDQMVLHFKMDWLDFFKTYGAVAARGCVAWLIFAPLAFLVLYYPLKIILKTTSQNKRI